jgi:cyanate permease|tara:strand:+ start:6398 stop:7606 length:1209 start_codon:yes stop_codon:yes gene_type:complete
MKESSQQNISYRWVMLAGVWLAYFSFGVVQGGIPPLIGPVSQDLGLSRTTMGTVLGAWPLIYILTAIPAGALLDRFNLKFTIMIGVIFIGISGLLRAIAVDYKTILFAVMVFGLGGPFISIGAPKLISTWFSESDRGRAMGIYLTAPAVGRILVLSATNSLLMPLYDNSWRLTLLTLAGVAFVTAIIWILIAKDLNPDNQNSGDKKDLLASMKTFPDLVRVREVRLILIIVLGMFLFNHATNNWLPEILIQKSLSSSKAGLLAAIPVATGAVGTAIIPQFAKPSAHKKIVFTLFWIAAACTICLIYFENSLLLSVLIVLGFASRGVMPIIMLTLISMVGGEKTGAAGGLYFTAGEVGGVLGPILLGFSADIFNGFAPGLFFLSSLCIALSFGSTIITKKHLI